MDTERGNTRFKWEYFIDPTTKAATPQFDDLCRSLAKVIRHLQPAHKVELSPDRLATFYTSCGGNRDELFRHTGDNGLSFMYRTLGCFHSLQPTKNAFEAPSIPCLTDDGFVRWQTLQLLLCPQDHAPMMQRAVQIYDVPRRGGGYFPKHMPADCFPARPDAEMEKWHRFVTSQMNQDYSRRLRNSPYQSPQPDPANGAAGYFVQPSPARRPSSSRRRQSMSDDNVARFAAAARRRSSVPDVLSPGGTPLYPEERVPVDKVRSNSSNRTTNSNQRPRANTSAPMYQYPPPERPPPERRAYQSPPNRHERRESMDEDRRRESRHSRNYSSHSRPVSSSGSSIEENYRSRKSRATEEERPRRPRWGSSLMPSFFLSNSKRRHSSDGRVPTLRNDKPRSPRRTESIRKYRSDGLPEPYMGPSSNRASRSSGRSNEFEMPPRPEEPPYGNPPTSYRYSEPQVNSYQPPHLTPPNRMTHAQYGPQQQPVEPPRNPYASFEASFTNPDARKYGAPLRVNTMGVNNRRYVPPENRSAVEPRMTTRRDRTASLRNPPTASVV